MSAAGSYKLPVSCVLLGLGVLGLEGCGKNTLGDGLPDEIGCNTCHGSEVNPAPPVSIAGAFDPAARSVGAHQAHLQDGELRRAVGCDECHVVPDTVDQAGHVDPLPAEVVFGPLATREGLSPSWDREAATCRNTYCHGATLAGGSNKIPEWTTVDGSQDACGTCHGVPPPLPHLQSTDCNSCHSETVDETGGIVAGGGKHIDGIVDFSGGACGSCHSVPPTPQNEQYPKNDKTHALHAGTLDYPCATCHGHNGTGPQHNQGDGTVLRANVDIVFDPAVVFPGGTTMENGGTPAEAYNSGNPTCWVGCHNPLPGDLPDLDNPAVWTDSTVSCADCHEQPGTGPDINHDLDPDAPDDPTISAGCRECHDTSGHTRGTVAIVDPDPGDADSFAGTGISGLCRTCHDGGPGSFFAGQTPVDQSDYWNTPTAHDGLELDCDFCHDHHGRSSGTVLVNREEDLCAFCHGSVVAEMSDAGTPTHHHIVDGEQSGASPLECTSCHDPHKVQKNPWRPVTDPVSKALLPAGDVPHDSGENPSAAFSDNARFCLTCHNGSWPGALNLAAELANKETLVTNFRRGTENLHFVHSEKLEARNTLMPCTYCHNAHANTGTSGTNRRALLYDWITVNRYPYLDKNSCSTGDALGRCH